MTNLNKYIVLSSNYLKYIENLYSYLKKNNKKINKKLYNFLKNIDKEKNCSKQYLNKIINNFRRYGYLFSDINPIFKEKTNYKKIFKLKENSSKFLKKNKNKSLHEIYNILKNIYCKSLGIEYMHLIKENEKKWIQNKIELYDLKKTFSSKEKKKILLNLISSETLEKYLNKKFINLRRFSLEGEESLILVLNEIIKIASKNKIKEIIIGMAHRGRENVLVNVLGINLKSFLNKFCLTNNVGIKDVPYHQGFYVKKKIKKNNIYIYLSYNSSHLESISPIILGITKSRLIKFKNKKKAISLILHGDSSIVGQGIVQESINLAQKKEYNVNGTIHIILNNQIGFTTDNLCNIKSNIYCSNIAKTINSPVIHVNADDPESSIIASRLATNFKIKFNKDVFIDLVGYRRNSHNEINDNNVTQPMMYKKIRKHPSVVKIYSKKLIKKKILNFKEVKIFENTFLKKIKNNKKLSKSKNIKNFFGKNSKKNFLKSYNISFNNLTKLAIKINTIPKYIKLDKKIKKIYKNRLNMANNKSYINWNFSELLAYGNLIKNGVSIRFSGEDIIQGTFFNRHIIVYDKYNGREYFPLSKLNKKNKIYIQNSILSELATLGFEYGYSISSEKTLVIWESQFGDFSNVAQTIFDQFIFSGYEKWGLISNLLIFLPHGLEGIGPDHSSSRIERHLQSCAKKNVNIYFPSTPYQMFYIINNQIYKKRPSIVISPKSILYSKLEKFYIKDLIRLTFSPIIKEKVNFKNNIIRVIFCSGKIYYELYSKRNKKNKITIIRIEQIYPFPYKQIKKILKSYLMSKDFVWCQEEPKNQGMWNYINMHFCNFFNIKLKYFGRPVSSIVEETNKHNYEIQQNKIIMNALNIDYLEKNK
ncbi:MAG: 2-oxoglutarate dehydrogenase E1 component [Enterobacteriaceae bacterium]